MLQVEFWMSKKTEEKIKWAEEYTKIKEDVLIVAKYYQKEKTKRWKNLVRIILDEDGLPNRNYVSRMMKRSYSRTILNEWKKEPSYPNKSIVCFRANSYVEQKLLNSQEGRKAFVLKSNVEIPNPSIGGKKYLILPFGSYHAIIVEERDIKSVKGKS